MARRLQLSDSRAIESALRNSHRGATPYSMQVHSSTTPTASRPSESYYFTWGTTVQKHKPVQPQSLHHIDVSHRAHRVARQA
jgi:hypothetical protein